MLFFPSWIVLQGFPWLRGDKIAASSKNGSMPNKYIFFSSSKGHVTSNCSVFLPAHTWSALAGPCVAQQNALPVHFPLATLEEDSNSNKAVSSRGCSQNHQGITWWKVSVCSCTHCSWLWSNLNKLEDDVTLISTSPGWDVALQSPNLIARVFQKEKLSQKFYYHCNS